MKPKTLMELIKEYGKASEAYMANKVLAEERTRELSEWGANMSPEEMREVKLDIIDRREKCREASQTRSRRLKQIIKLIGTSIKE